MISKHILLGVSGGIAAYKSCELVRLLRRQGHEVTVAMSRSAENFVSPLTFQALSGRPVYTDGTDGGDGMAHIHLTREADVMLIAPATMNTLSKIAAGVADNLLSNLAAARKCPLAVAPAMNVEMWHNPANQRNLARLAGDGVTVFAPGSGEQACGESGLGRMAETEELADLLADVWTEKVLAGRRVLLTAGATFEAIDPVRGITNLSSGKMGMALARALRAAGAQVTLVHGLLQARLPSGLAETVRAESAEEMYAAVMARVGRSDVFVSVAAVADYRVANRSAEKLKKAAGAAVPVIELIENPDILATVAALEAAPFCVGFAAESHCVLEYARAKRLKKGVPLMVANRVDQAMGTECNQVTLIGTDGETVLPEMDKTQTAAAIVRHLAVCMGGGS